ncbi:NUDIX domain-containing protein [Halococcus agarilyticus]|uniref:NUDIX domain-containing protein n=1 Tax=Halococcus agarilyticus TaxID=1232219 RepID=UPI000677EB6D|nr:NUDIX domain-containing protein [Halococcus agarilyticus]
MVWSLQGERPTYCPRCGEKLGERDHENTARPYCADCACPFYRNPAPLARATVIDGDRAVLIERGRAGDVGAWALPGGYIDGNESPPEAAARELAEETGLVATPDDLELIGCGHLDFDDACEVSFNFAVPRVRTDGTPAAGDDAATTRWFSREELSADPPDHPSLRASGPDQILAAIERFGEPE